MSEKAGSPAESRLVVTARSRPGARLRDPALSVELEDPSLETLSALCARAAVPSRLWLYGGEPTLRSDLPELLREIVSSGTRGVGLRTDGMALRDARSVEPLVRAGLARARVVLHSTRFDAHDFISGMRGSGARALRAVKVLVELGLDVEVEAVVARVNAPYLGELVRLARELRIGGFYLRRLVLSRELLNDAVTLSPRLGLTEPYLEEAAAVAAAHATRIAFDAFPECALGEARRAAAPAREWLVPDGFPAAALEDPPAHPEVRCHGCGGGCAGAPSDYVARFGVWEFLSERLSDGATGAPTPRPRPQPGDDVVAPAPRGARSPATRLRTVRGLASTAELDGDPLVPRGDPVVGSTIRLRWRGASRLDVVLSDEPATSQPEPTRAARQRLARVAQYGARRLRIVGDSVLTHPDLGELIGELPLLSVPELELAAEGSALSALPDAVVERFACFQRVDAPLFDATADGHNACVLEPDAFDRTLAGVGRLGGRLPGTVAVFAVVDGPERALVFAEAWARGALPGTPSFRLATRGGSLDELAGEGLRLADPVARRALEDVLPACLRPAGSEARPPEELGLEFTFRPEPRDASACDRIGSYRPCRCGPDKRARCPGVAAGWTSSRIEIA